MMGGKKRLQIKVSSCKKKMGLLFEGRTENRKLMMVLSDNAFYFNKVYVVLFGLLLFIYITENSAPLHAKSEFLTFLTVQRANISK